MTQMMKMRGALLGALLGTVACTPERSVEMSFESTPQDGQVVQNDFIEMREGQAMVVRVVAVKKDEVQPEWSVEAKSEDSSKLKIQRKYEEDDGDGEVFVFSAPQSGDAEITFTLDGEFEVVVDAQIAARGEWEPTVPPNNFGGEGAN